MKKTTLFVSFLFCTILIVAQSTDNRYVAFLKDKNNNPYTISNPSEFLSERAIERRMRYSIPLDQFDLPVTPNYVAQIEATGAQVVNVSKWLNTVTFSTSDLAVVESVGLLPFVDSVNNVFPKGSLMTTGQSGINSLAGIPPFEFHQASEVTAGAGFKSTSTLDYGISANQITMVNLQQLHDAGFTGSGMLIAVLDAGFANVTQIVAFDSLWDNSQILGWRDIAQPGNDLFAATMNSHGTSVLSVMGSNLPGQIVGTAPHASYFLIRTEEGATESIVEEYNWAAGAELADSLGADVINSSLGYSTFDNPLFNHTYADMDGATTPITIAGNRAASRGMLVVNSAGNSGGSSWQYIGAPADGAGVFTIGAVDNSGQYASFSSTGPTSDGRIKPDVTAQGQGTALVSGGGDIGWGSGTSFSSPLIAGAVACLWQSAPERSAGELKNALRFTASKSAAPDNYYGYGIPDFGLAQLSINIGEPLTDAPKAVVVSNPFVNYPSLMLSFSDFIGSVDVGVFDINGRHLFHQVLETVGEAEVIQLREFSQLPSGIFIIRIDADGAIQNLKAIKL